MWRFNLDGFVLHTLRDDLTRQCYTQLFRDGGIEVMRGSVLAKDGQRSGFYVWGMEDAVISRFANYSRFWSHIGVTPPLLIALTLSGVQGWKVLRGPYSHLDREAAFDRDVVMPPEVIMLDLQLRPMWSCGPLFDFIWNGGGWPASPNYREGRWVKPQ